MGESDVVDLEAKGPSYTALHEVRDSVRPVHRARPTTNHQQDMWRRAGHTHTPTSQLATEMAGTTQAADSVDQ